MVWTKVTVSSYMYYYTVNLSPSVIIRDAVIITVKPGQAFPSLTN